MREVHQDETSQVELFLNSVPILASLTREEKMMLVDALEEQAYAPASRVINQVCIFFMHASIHSLSSNPSFTICQKVTMPQSDWGVFSCVLLADQDLVQASMRTEPNPLSPKLFLWIAIYHL